MVKLQDNNSDRYINIFTDFGFKKIFGEEANKDILIDFLNNLLAGKEIIKDLTFNNIEHLGITPTDRKAIFDLYCENDKGEKFIIELQKSKQQFFKDRSLYYATFPIQEQAKKGDWNFKLKAVYLVGILDFVFEEDKDSSKYKHVIKLKDDETNKVFYDKLSFIYLEMPKFNKEESELKTSFDKWMYALKFLPYLQDRPKILQEKIFKKLFNIAEISNLDGSEHKKYESSLKYYRDLKNVVDTARYEGIDEGFEQGIERGIEQGIEQGKQEEKKAMAVSLKNQGVSLEIIIKSTGLSKEEIENLNK